MPTLECSSEVWEPNKTLAAALESVVLAGIVLLFVKDL